MLTDKQNEEILRKRMHGLYLSRKCSDLHTLSIELMGLHSWFYRNVAFSAFLCCFISTPAAQESKHCFARSSLRC